MFFTLFKELLKAIPFCISEKPSLFSDSKHYQAKRKFCEDTERSSEESEIIDNQ